jgi:uncharacterized membrane protein
MGSGGQQVPKLFLILGACLALVYVFLVPPFQVTDEDRHFIRAYSVADAKLAAPALTNVPVSFLRLRDRFPPSVVKHPEKRSATVTELRQWLHQPLQSKITEPVENRIANIYSFVPYVPVALALNAGRLLKMPPLAQIWAGRMANAAVYLWMAYVALLWLPDFHLPLMAIALTPMSLNLAASYSEDAFTMGIAALLTAYLFRLAFDPEIKIITTRDGIRVLVMLALLSLCKLNVWTGLLVLLIPAKKMGGRRGLWLFAITCVIAASLTGLAWQEINRSAILAYQAQRASRGVDLAANSSFMLHHPAAFLSIIAATCASSLLAWLWELVGVFGWVTVPLPAPLFVVYIVLLIIAACTLSRTSPTTGQRYLLAVFVLLTLVSVHALMWIFQAKQASLAQAAGGTVLIEGIQGRYFLPIALPALAIIGNRRLALSRTVLPSSVAVILTVHLFAFQTIWNWYR